MSDPYIPLERKLRLTRQALELIAQYRFPIHMITKSDMVMRDTDVLKTISQTYAAISFTLTTTDDELAGKVEPFAPRPSQRLAAIKELSKNGIYTGITMMPILPFIEDNVENVVSIVKKARDAGAQYIIPAFSMTLRNKQRQYYYDKLDIHFPGLSEKYRKIFGDRYGCSARNYKQLKEAFNKTCEEVGMSIGMKFYQPEPKPKQMELI